MEAGLTSGRTYELTRQAVPGAVVCLFNDAASAAACYAAGEGAAVQLSLSGKSAAVPCLAGARVLRLTDGAFTRTGPVAVGGLCVVVVSVKMQATLWHMTIEPAEVPVLALESAVHFRADCAPLAREVIVAAAPGPVVAASATLPFTNVRPGLRRRLGANR